MGHACTLVSASCRLRSCRASVWPRSLSCSPWSCSLSSRWNKRQKIGDLGKKGIPAGGCPDRPGSWGAGSWEKGCRGWRGHGQRADRQTDRWEDTTGLTLMGPERHMDRRTGAGTERGQRSSEEQLRVGMMLQAQGGMQGRKGWMEGWTDGRTEGWKDGWRDGSIDGGMEG